MPATPATSRDSPWIVTLPVGEHIGVVAQSQCEVHVFNQGTRARLSPETLFIFLRSTPIQTVLKWSQDGSQHPRFNEDDLLAIPVPTAVENVSAKVDALVNKSLAARDESLSLRQDARVQIDNAILKVANQ
jgi:hypothetical protein